ncbi:LacI family DNA-binding transcriptional regulator [Deinococcus roseus]|uniref:LacI family transcriptional regulator n=1 Tax=Deinococcus roseus TaxID=392414 RepID=A0ABQ2DE95_9DEIO|nr:LacI family DNA-binding transcriptional regulator [Deinococcus roseus]GGJ53543.1 LacI family transcriptional regulator [Deinococcus roseus]
MSTQPHKPAVITDVAKRAGVSHQTVSRVLNKHPSVSEHTRKKVLEAIQELDYRPNLTARSLVTRKTSTIGVVSCGSSQYGPSQMVYGIELAARDANYHVIITNITELTREQISDAIDHLMNQQVEGIILITPLIIKLGDIKDLLPSVPYVLIDAPWGIDLPTVMIDQVSGARKITRHVLDRGHQKIAFLSGPLHWSDARGRLEGFQQEMQHDGLVADLIVEADWSAEGGFLATQKLLKKNFDFTAMIAANDQMALGAIRAFKDAGLRVPEDISIVGFDDIPEAAFFDPPLTTIKQNFGLLGKRGVTHLLERLSDPHTDVSQSVIQTQLVPRHSVKDLTAVGKERTKS